MASGAGARHACSGECRARRKVSANRRKHLHERLSEGHAPKPVTTDGEAKNPGPNTVAVPFELFSQNFTSLMAHLDVVQGNGSPISCVQETKLTDRAQLKLQRKAAFKDWTMVLGAPLSSSKQAGGVAILARPGVNMRKVPPQCEGGRELWESTRFCHAAVGVGTDQTIVHIVCLYGFTNAGQSSDARKSNESFLAKVFAYLATFGDVPFIIAGDFNTECSQSATMYGAVQTGRWMDAAELQQGVDGRQKAKTCFVHETSKGSRVDSILLSRGLSSTFRNLSVDEETGVTVHRALRLLLDLEFCQQSGVRFAMPRAFPLREQWVDPDKDAEEYQQWEATQRVLQSTQQDWERAFRERDPEQMLKVFSESAESYISWRAYGRERGPRVHLGRGSAKLQAHRTHAPHASEEGAIDSRQRSLLKLTRGSRNLSGSSHCGTAWPPLKKIPGHCGPNAGKLVNLCGKTGMCGRGGRSRIWAPSNFSHVH